MAEGGRVLILDDDVQVAATIGAMVTASGFESRIVEDSDGFFRQLGDWAPTHIVLDLMMPGMDGVEVLRHLGERGSTARIIISSGLDERVIDAAGRAAAEYRLTVVGRLTKPFRLGRLRELLLREDADEGSPASPALQQGAKGVSLEELDDALAGQALELHYQPIISCCDHGLAGFEALLRLRRRDGSLATPDRFIPLAEHEGRMERITWQVFDLGIDWLRRTPPAQAPGLAMNLSARNLGRLDLADGLSALCAKAGVDPGRVTLEMTETAAMDDPGTALELMTRLRVKGFRLALDDFGTGYSSMIQLARLPFSEIKLDKSFVLTARESQESRTIVRSIIELGHSLGLQAVAEGVENRATLDLLAETGCDLAQGFHIGRPMPEAELPAWHEGYRGRRGA